MFITVKVVDKQSLFKYDAYVEHRQGLSFLSFVEECIKHWSCREKMLDTIAKPSYEQKERPPFSS